MSELEHIGPILKRILQRLREDWEQRYSHSDQYTQLTEGERIEADHQEHIIETGKT
jgi:hypothetical protein